MKLLRWVNPFTSGKRFVLFGVVILILVSAVGLLRQPVYAARFTQRSLTIDSAVLNANTTYTIQFGFPGSSSVGSVQFEFCDDPIPTEPCTPVPGLDIAAATLSSQTGETGFTVTQQTSNKMVLSRTPAATSTQPNTYVLTNVKNPSVAEQTFYVRITSYASTDASGNFIDYGGVASAATLNVGVQTQVPPELIFCLSLVITQFNCSTIVGGNYVDFGELDADQTYATQSQMIARTNIDTGYNISVYGIGVTAGNKTIDSLSVPTPSATGNSQFGINLVQNSSPSIGEFQFGPGVVANINPDYALPNQFVYRSGDTLITTSGASDFKLYTTTYVLNRPPTQAPGVYATTVTYICSASF